MYLGSAPCWRQAKLLGALIIRSKQAVASLSTMITHICIISAISYERTLVIARSIALQPCQPPHWLLVMRWAFSL